MAHGLPPGIRRHGAGYQVRAKYRGELTIVQFPIDATLREMIDAQADELAKLRLLTKDRPKAGTLAADARTYLQRPTVKALDDYAQREQHIAEWCAVLGSKRRRSGGWKDAIEAQRDRWLSEPRTVERRGEVVALPPYAPNSVNKRLRALSNLWTELDGPRAPNPVLEVSECEEPDPEARGLPYDVIEAILAAIPETAIGVTKHGIRTTGKNIPRPSKTKARLRVIAYTGLAHQQLKLLTREDVDLELATVRVIARRKGRKHRRAHEKPIPVLLPLIPQAVEAFKEFDRLNCWGEFSNSSMWKAFQRACATLGIKGLRPYDFRHSYLTVVYDETRDQRVTAAMGSHRSDRTSRRYTLAAVAPHVHAAALKVAARLVPSAGPRESKQDAKD